MNFSEQVVTKYGHHLLSQHILTAEASPYKLVCSTVYELPGIDFCGGSNMTITSRNSSLLSAVHGETFNKYFILSSHVYVYFLSDLYILQ